MQIYTVTYHQYAAHHNTVPHKRINMKLLIRLSKLKLGFLLKRQTPDNKDEVDNLILSLLKPDAFRKENIVVSSKIRLDVIFASITEYNKRLTLVNTILKQNTYISPDWCKYDYRKVPYEDYFTNGSAYVDKEKEIQAFITLVKQLRFELYIIKDEQTGVNGHNLRQMSRFHTHLSDLIVQLIRSSHEISLSQF